MPIGKIARVVLPGIASKRRAVRAASRGLARLAENLKAYWPLMVAAASGLLALAAWLSLGVSPLESAREIAHKKQQRRSQQELARRHIELGNDFLNVAQLQAAKAEFTQAKDFDAYSFEAELGLLKVSVFEPVTAEDYDPEVAERRLQAIRKQRPDDTHALAFLGDVYRSVDPDEATRYYDQAVASDATNAWAYQGKGVLLDLAGRTADALPLYEKAASLSGWNQTFLNNLAYQYFLRGDYRKAEELYVRLLRLDTRFFLSYCMLANTQMMLGHPESAYRNLLLLDARLKDGASVKLTRNQGTWFFHRKDKSKIYLSSDAEKAAYGRYLTALAGHLLGLDREVERYLSEARASGLRDTVSVEQLIDADISNLGETRPQLVRRLLSFNLARRAKR